MTTVEAPASPASPSDLLNTANLAIQISVGIIALVTLLIALAALFGLRELGSIRKRGNELKAELVQSIKAREVLETRLESLEGELDSLVFVAHLFNEGQTAYATADYDRAIYFFNEALQVQPNNSKIQVRLARCYINKSMNSRAERLLRAATASDPNSSDAWRALSTSRRYVNLREAISHAERALEIDGSNDENWNYLGILLRDDERFHEALEAHEEAIRISPSEPLGYFYKALLLTRLGETDEAALCLRESFAKVEALRKTGRIKEIWASTVEWGYRRHLDTADQDARAAEIALDLSKKCRERRNRQALLSHMTFYLSAVGAELETDLSLSWFPQAEVHAATQPNGT